MDIATMAALNSVNTANMLHMIAAANQNVITILKDGKEEQDMSGSMLDAYVGKECVVSLFNEVGAMKGKLLDADAQWVKLDTGKKGIQLINRNMVRNINFDNR